MASRITFPNGRPPRIKIRGCAGEHEWALMLVWSELEGHEDSYSKEWGPCMACGQPYKPPVRVPVTRTIPDYVALLKATVGKQRAEKKLMHEMLTEAGIAEDVLHDGVRTCLPGRLAVALTRVR